MDDRNVDRDTRDAQFSLRSLFLMTAVFSGLLAAWRTTGSVIPLLLAIQTLLVWMLWLDARVFSRDKFSYLSGCAAIVAMILLSWLLVVTILLVVFGSVDC